MLYMLGEVLDEGGVELFELVSARFLCHLWRG